MHGILVGRTGEGLPDARFTRVLVFGGSSDGIDKSQSESIRETAITIREPVARPDHAALLGAGSGCQLQPRLPVTLT